jgi:hypothetical protein
MNIEARVGRTGDRTAVVLSVTDDAGKPVTDLAAEHISVYAASGATAGPEVAVAGVAARGEGVYLVDIVLGPLSASWPAGEHVLVVGVRRVFDRGQSLAVLTIP